MCFRLLNGLICHIVLLEIDEFELSQIIVSVLELWPALLSHLTPKKLGLLIFHEDVLNEGKNSLGQTALL